MRYIYLYIKTKLLSDFRTFKMLQMQREDKLKRKEEFGKTIFSKFLDNE